MLIKKLNCFLKSEFLNTTEGSNSTKLKNSSDYKHHYEPLCLEPVRDTCFDIFLHTFYKELFTLYYEVDHVQNIMDLKTPLKCCVT
jgi:hypothetical protein